MLNDEAFTWEESTQAEAREAANAWVARFAPLVMDEKLLGVRAIKERLKVVEELEGSGPAIKQRLQSFAHDDDWNLLQTVEKAIEQLPSIEASLRRQLGASAPGDPAGIANLDKLNEKLAERSAREELGIAHEPNVPEILELRTSPRNIGAAAAVGLFGFGWTSFTAVHAVFMIGGMMQAFGWAALFLLGFYAIFFGVGFAMFAAAFQAASEESIELSGRDLVIRRRFGSYVREKRFQIAADARAKIGKVSTWTAQNKQSSAKTQAILLTDVDGKPISFGSGQPNEHLREQVEQINAYLRVKG